MIKLSLPDLGIETIIQEYSLTKKREDIAVLSEITTKARFPMPDYDTLFRLTVEGQTEEPALITVFCAQEFEEFEAMIRHNEGSYLHKACIAEKNPKLINPFECIRDLEINIFDYPADDIKSSEGTFEKKVYSASGVFFVSDGTQLITLDEALATVGGLGPLPSLGWFAEYINIDCRITVSVQNDPTYGDYETYTGHFIGLYVSYVRQTSPTKLSENWLPLPASEGPGYYFVGPSITFNSPQIGVAGVRDLFGPTYEYLEVSYTAGRFQNYTSTDISNMVDFNKMMEGIFECVPYPLVSNFFGINSDGSNPLNEEYAYALEYLQELRIAQSYDIIKEAATDDSFGKSGLLKVKKFLTELSRIFELILIYDPTEEMLRYEHISYFSKKGLNMVSNDIDYELADTIEVNKELVNKEYFRFAKSTPTEGFYESTVDYLNYTIADKLNERIEASELIITDYAGLLNNPEFATDEYKKLFFLISTKSGAIREYNKSLSMVNITNALKLTNRFSLQGLKDGLPVIFKGYSIGLTTEVTFGGSISLFQKLNPMNSIKLKNGVWLIEEIEYKNTKNLTLKIRK